MTRLGDDTLWGCRQIADHMHQSERKTSYMLERGQIPAGKIGSGWVASRQVLDGYIAQRTGADKLRDDDAG